MSDISSVSSAAAAAVPAVPAPAAVQAATKAKQVYEKTAEQLIQSVAPAKQDSAQISPQAQALLAASRPPV